MVYANSYTLFLFMKSVPQILVLYELEHIFICILQIVTVLLNVPLTLGEKVIIIIITVRTPVLVYEKL